MTGTPFCMIPVTSLGSEPIGDGKVGGTTTRLLEAWGGNVGVDIVSQIKAWDSAPSNQKTGGPTPYSFKAPR